MKLKHVGKTSIVILSLIALPVSNWAQEDVLPQPYEVYGGTIGTIDAIQIPGETNKTRVFASTASANSVFYGDVDHTKAAPFGTNFIVRVLPDMDANANFGAPNSLAAHQQSGRVFVGSSSGLLSCTTSAGSLVTEMTEAVSFVLIQGAYLFAVNDPSMPETPKTLYYGTISSAGHLTLSAPLAASFTGTVSLAVNLITRKLYVLCSQTTGFVLLKSSSDYDSFTSATTFLEIPTTGVTVSPVEQVGISPDGRLFLGGGSSTLKVAYSDDGGGSWTNIDTGGNLAGVGSGLNIVCNGDTNAYEVFYGTVVSTNKGANGSWIGLPRPGGYRPPSMHVNGGCTKVDPNNSQFIYVTTDKGIGGSTNSVMDVVELNNGLLAFQINDIDALSSKTVAWIASKAGIRIATNFNTTPVWADGDFPDAIVFACAIDSDDPSGMTGYAGSSRLYKTTTGGGTNASAWVSVFRWEDYGLTDGEIASVKAKGSQVVLGYYSYAQNSPSGGVFFSSNGGSNWTAVITNIDVQDILMRDEGGTDVAFVAVSKGKIGDRGGIYRMDDSTVALDMTNEVNIRKLAEDSTGGIYASGTLPDASDPSRHCVVAYYRAGNASGWEQLTTNGLPTGLWEGAVLGRVGGPPVITVGKDSTTNDVPVLAVMRTIYYLPYGGSSWVTITNYPNGTQIKTLFYDELMVGTTIGLYGQGINAVPASETAFVPLAADFDGDAKSDPAVYGRSTGNYYIRLSASGYAAVTTALGTDGDTYPVAADFDGDRLADPAGYESATGRWIIRLSGSGYAAVTTALGTDGDTYPVAADFDGDRLADPAEYESATGRWIIRLSGSGYAAVTATLATDGDSFPVAVDFDGDAKADLGVYDKATPGIWYFRLSASGYATASLTFSEGDPDRPVAADFDGDAKADPAGYESATGKWIIKLSGSGYATVTSTILSDGTGYPVAADFDGDAKADPAVAQTSTGHWKLKLSDSGYGLLDLPNFLGE